MKRKINLQNVKGSYDYKPEEARIRNYIQDTLKKIFMEYGYRPLETPILCYYDLLAGKYDESNDLLNEIYKLTDQGKRELGLRYDLTVPFAKYIAMEKDLRLPFKRFEIGKVFRDGPVKTGRDREFLQCDVDVVGLEGAGIETELMSLWLKGYSALGIDVYIKYNNRNLMRGLIETIGVKDEEKITSIVTVIDKIDKIDERELLKELGELGIEEIDSKTLLGYFNLKLDELVENTKNSNSETLNRGIEEIKELESMLKETGLSKYAIFTPSLARGQDYYTGDVFEVYAKNGELSCSLGGGGRYDKMITDFIDDGNIYPAVGVSFGLSTIYEILKNREDFKDKPYVDILIVPMGTIAKSLCLADDIRSLGYKVEVDLSGKKIKRSMEYADRKNIPYVIVLGENEIEKGTFELKNMSSGEKTSIELDNLEKITKYFL